MNKIQLKSLTTLILFGAAATSCLLVIYAVGYAQQLRHPGGGYIDPKDWQRLVTVLAACLAGWTISEASASFKGVGFGRNRLTMVTAVVCGGLLIAIFAARASLRLETLSPFSAFEVVIVAALVAVLTAVLDLRWRRRDATYDSVRALS